jgi:hypothetical protein
VVVMQKETNGTYSFSFLETGAIPNAVSRLVARATSRSICFGMGTIRIRRRSRTGAARSTAATTTACGAASASSSTS